MSAVTEGTAMLSQAKPASPSPEDVMTSDPSEPDRDQFGYAKPRPRTQSQNSVSSDAGDEDEEYTDVLSEGGAPVPIPSLPSPLSEEDEQPLADLQEFLSNNRRVCRPSYRDSKTAPDPVGDLKNFLIQLQA
jgi:hypothetical protein